MKRFMFIQHSVFQVDITAASKGRARSHSLCDKEDKDCRSLLK